ncbi:MAG: DUF4012 domain-containing protein [Candidatus Magasanikbacteria bacterium]|nr:DUF4012 domain-containing protein [Candidatus Magasanikbacteria bacterium]
MLESDKKNKRKCSVCREVGHNKRKCPDLMKTEKKTNTRKSPMVVVSVGKLHRKSPHVVNLRGEKKEDVWSKVDVYRDESVVKEERRVVSLAEMVRQANSQRVESSTQGASVYAEKLKVESRKKETTSARRKEKKVKTKKITFKSPMPYVLGLKSGIQKKVSSTLSSVIQTQKDFVSAFNFKRFAYSMVALFLLVAIPFPAIGYYNNIKNTGNLVVEQSTNAFMSLQSSTVAALNSNLDQAQYDLNSALQSFGNASSVLEKEHRALQFVAGVLPVIGKQIKSRQHLLVAGHHLALGNTYLVKGIRSLEEQTDLHLTDKIGILAAHLKGAIPQYKEALEELGGVDQKSIPVEYQESFDDFRLLFTAFVDDMQDISNLAETTEMIFGGSEFRRYLLVFQNNNEIRPTGGFMGSFAIMDVQKGKIVNLDVPGGGTYDLQGQLDTYVKPPLPLQLINDRWEFQDANWFPDFAASAQKMAWFYEHGRGATVDGVMAINATVLERMLSVLGPMVSMDHGLEIASDNALEVLQYEVEVDYDKEKNQPKEVIGDLAQQFLGSLGDLETVDALRLLSELNESLQNKEIQVYFSEDNLQQKLTSFNWTGQILPTAEGQDYLQVVNTNIRGQKSDAKIEQTIEHQALIEDDGSIVDTVVVHRKHTGILGQTFYGVNNVNYIRVYVPEGAELIDAGGFNYPPEDAFEVPEAWYEDDVDLALYEQEIAIHTKTGTRITSEFGKTAYGNWMMTMPGETSSVYFVYRLPFKLNLNETLDSDEKISDIIKDFTSEEMARYSLSLQKQSGIDSGFSTQIIAPDGWVPIWQTNDDMVLASNGAEFETVLETDEALGLVLKKK